MPTNHFVIFPGQALFICLSVAIPVFFLQRYRDNTLQELIIGEW